MTTDTIAYRKHLEERLVQLGQEQPGPMSGFARLHKKAIEGGALNTKTKARMALAISIAVRCEGCIAYHTHDAVAAGATREELLETIRVHSKLVHLVRRRVSAAALNGVRQASA